MWLTLSVWFGLVAGGGGDHSISRSVVDVAMKDVPHSELLKHLALHQHLQRAYVWGQGMGKWFGGMQTLTSD